MADPLESARAVGDVPQAPGFLGWTSAWGASVGVICGLMGADWDSLAMGAWGLSGEVNVFTVGHAVLSQGVWGAVLGALVGLMAGAAAMGALTPGLRLRLETPEVSRGYGLWALLSVFLGATMLPGLLSRVGQGDPGRLLAYTPLCALFVGGLALIPVVLVQRARAIRNWRARRLPSHGPRRDPDALQPELKAALRQRAGEPPAQASALSMVITSDEYAIGLLFNEGRAPRVMRHGGYFLLAEARAANVDIIEDPILAHALAGIPTGESVPESTWSRLIHLSRHKREPQ